MLLRIHFQNKVYLVPPLAHKFLFLNLDFFVMQSPVFSKWFSIRIIQSTFKTNSGTHYRNRCIILQESFLYLTGFSCRPNDLAVLNLDARHDVISSIYNYNCQWMAEYIKITTKHILEATIAQPVPAKIHRQQ